MDENQPKKEGDKNPEKRLLKKGNKQAIETVTRKKPKNVKNYEKGRKKNEHV